MSRRVAKVLSIRMDRFFSRPIALASLNGEVGNGPIVLNGQVDPSENGVYVRVNGSWVRRSMAAVRA